MENEIVGIETVLGWHKKVGAKGAPRLPPCVQVLAYWEGEIGAGTSGSGGEWCSIPAQLRYLFRSGPVGRWTRQGHHPLFSESFLLFHWLGVYEGLGESPERPNLVSFMEISRLVSGSTTIVFQGGI